MAERPALDWITEAGQLLVRGALTRPAIEQVAGLRLPDLSGPSVDINLGQVRAIDSSGMALLVGWEGEGAARGLQLRYTHAPNAMMAMIELYGLSDILQVSERRH